MKLSKKAKGYLKKCQLGGMPYIDPAESFDQEIWNSANSPMNAAQVPFLSLNQQNDTSSNTKLPAQQGTDNSQSSFLDSIPAIGNLVLGVSSLVNSGKQRRESRQLKKIFDQDNKRRMEEQRGNDFYATPYTTGRSSNYGKSYAAYQMGGISLPDQVDYFNEMYSEKEKQKIDNNQNIQGFYDQLVLNKKNQAKQSLQTGLGQTIKGGIDVAKMFLQQGGVLPLTKEELRRDENTKKNIPTDENKTSTNTNINTNFFLSPASLTPTPTNHENSSKSKSKDRFREQKIGGVIFQDGGLTQDNSVNSVNSVNTEDLYSKDFVSPWAGEDSSQVTQDVPESSPMTNWIFQDDEPLKDYSVNDEYFSKFQPDFFQTPTTSGSNILSEIAQKESGGNYKAVNPRGGASGKYQFMPSSWSNSIREYMHLPMEMSQDQIMSSFRESPNTQDAFMEHVYKDIYLPKVEQLRPLAKKYGFTDDQVVKMLHYRGVADTERRLKSGNFSVSQAEKNKYKNPDILDYIK